jgi:protein-L-isoaspartate(D-aspartate) O-methyltransferase
MAPIDLHAAKQRMLHSQLRRRGIHDERVLAAMAKIPREQFVCAELHDDAYSDCALRIDCNQTISQPYMVALMTEALQLYGGEKVLEIGTGSGYQTAILSELCREVVSIERHGELSVRAGVILAGLGCKNVTLIVGDGTLGYVERAPYDRILVTAAAARAPQPLIEQLADGGIIVIPLGGRDVQTLQAIEKVGGQSRLVNLSACRFVPLVGEEGWPE